MNMTGGFRRIIAGAVLAVAAPTVLALPVAQASPDPCNPVVVGTVTDSINGYLNRHPDVNQALIDINNNPPGQVGDAYDDYFDRHPDVASELRALKGPLSNLNCLNDALPPQVVNALLAL